MNKLLATGFAAAMLFGVGARAAMADTASYTWEVYGATFGYWSDENGSPFGNGSASNDPDGQTNIADGGQLEGSFTLTDTNGTWSLTDWNLDTTVSSSAAYNVGDVGFTGQVSPVNSDPSVNDTYTTDGGSVTTPISTTGGQNVEFASSDSGYYGLDLFFAADLTTLTDIGTSVALCTMDTANDAGCNGNNLGQGGMMATTEWTTNLGQLNVGVTDEGNNFLAPTRSLNGNDDGNPNDFVAQSSSGDNPCGVISGPCVVLTSTATPVPEPGTLPVMLTALVGLGLLVLRRRASA